MTIDEIKAEKLNLQRTILRVVQEFERKTKCSVESVTLTEFTTYGQGEYKAICEVEVSI